MKILIVEDNPYKAVELIRALKNLNYTDILEAGDRETAVKILEKEKIELVLLDMFFPDHKFGGEVQWCGFKILDWLKERELHIPVICTSTVRTAFQAYPDCIGQMLYGRDDVEFRLKELIDQIPYLYE